MTCVIVDDNKVARMAMAHLVGMVKDLHLLAECDNAIACFEWLKTNETDLLLLDIEMPEMTGIELTRHLIKKDALIIFTTAKQDYAVEAFELNVVDYLIKPVSPPRFLKAIEKAREVFESKKQDIKIAEKEFVFVKDSGVLKKVNISDIIYLEAMGDYVKLHTGQRFHVIHATLKSLEEKLPVNFMRVHRSFIVALNQIEYIEEGIIHIQDYKIPVAEAYRSVLQKRLNLL